MRALKVLVVILGVMIVVVAGLVVYGMVTKFSNLTGSNADTTGHSSEIFADQIISLAPTAKVIDYVANETRLVIRVSDSEGGVRFLIFDLSTGKQMGSIRLKKSDSK
jgi:hypothetical protein